LATQKFLKEEIFMKYLVVAKPGITPIPPEHGAELLQAANAWLDAKIADGSIDVTYNFFGGGGFAISNSDSHENVLENLLSYPMYPFFEWEVKAILDREQSIAQYIAFYQKMGSM
jgi:hypothetical protein